MIGRRPKRSPAAAAMMGADLTETRERILDWLAQGVTLDEIRSGLLSLRERYRDAGLEADEDRVLEVLDVVEGWVSPHLKLPAP